MINFKRKNNLVKFASLNKNLLLALRQHKCLSSRNVCSLKQSYEKNIFYHFNYVKYFIYEERCFDTWTRKMLLDHNIFKYSLFDIFRTYIVFCVTFLYLNIVMLDTNDFKTNMLNKWFETNKGNFNILKFFIWIIISLCVPFRNTFQKCW